MSNNTGHGVQITGPITVSAVTGTISAVDTITNPVTVSSVTGSISAVDTITNPVTVSSVTGSISAVDTITNPVTVASVTNPLTVASVTNPLTVASVTNPITVDTVTNPITIGSTVNVQNTPLYYQNTAFGERRTGIDTPVVQADFVYDVNDAVFNKTATGSGTLTELNGLCTVNTTAAASSGYTVETKRKVRYKDGSGVISRFTAIYTTGVAGSMQLVGIGDADNGLFYGYNGATFGILRRSDTVDNWIPQTTWNQDVMDGTGPTGMTLDTTTGNVFQIQFQWLGFGQIKFFIEDEAAGTFALVHTINYANANTLPHIRNPSFPFHISVLNTSNTTALSVSSASLYIAIEGGVPRVLGPAFSYVDERTGITGTLVPIITLHNKTSYKGQTNKNVAYLTRLSLAADSSSNRPQIITVILNGTLGGTPSFADISTTTSFMEVDTAGTTITGGKELVSFTVGREGPTNLTFQVFEFFLEPDDFFSFCGRTTAGTAEITVAVNWVEDI